MFDELDTWTVLMKPENLTRLFGITSIASDIRIIQINSFLISPWKHVAYVVGAP